MVEPSWVGRRVSIRRVLERGSDGRLLFGDVVGDLVGLDAQTAVVDTRRGLVEVPVGLVAAAKVVPASTADELALEAVAARGVRAAETEQLGGWLLRADHGFLRRANSVLPLRQLGMPLDDALRRARDWYHDRGLPLRISIPTEARRLLDAELGERGWPVDAEAHLMVARLDRLRALESAAAGPRDFETTISTEPDDAWLEVYRGGEGRSRHGRAMLARHDRVAFLTLGVDGRPMAIGRGVVDDGWLGVSGVEVTPEARRRGVATAVMSEMWRWGGRHGAERSYLQVEVENVAAVALYRGLGYWVHHDYRYRTDPDTVAPRP